MAKVSLDSTRWVTVAGGDLSIDLLMRRLTILEQTELSEIAACERQHIIERETNHTGRTEREIFITQEPGRLVRAQKFMLDNVVRGWRDLEDDKGKPLEFSAANLDRVLGAYPDWARALIPVAREYANLPPLDNPKGKAPGAPDPQPGSEPEPQPS